MWSKYVGDRNIASLDLKELGDRFKTAELFGKLANIGDDIGMNSLLMRLYSANW